MHLNLILHLSHAEGYLAFCVHLHFYMYILFLDLTITTDLDIGSVKEKRVMFSDGTSQLRVTMAAPVSDQKREVTLYIKVSDRGPHRNNLCAAGVYK